MAPGFSALVVLGDSLSDNGNAGRFSNGPVWVEHLAEALGLELRPARLGGTNHAVGGARATGGPHDLRAQADRFLASARGRARPDALYVVYGGANDVLAAGLAYDRHAAVRAAAEALGGIVADLVAAGARRLLVPNLPDIGLAPVVRALGPAWQAEARRLAVALNEALDHRLAGPAGEGAGIVRLDVLALGDRLLADPGAAGFRDVLQPCLGEPSCEGALFWDHLHPTTAAHRRLAAAAATALGVPVAGR